MTGPITPGEIDALIHERVRLGIVSALAMAPELSFVELKDSLSLTDGNLSVHARVLEEAGYVRIEKTFVGRKPRTTMSLTSRGRKAFRKYLEQLQRIVSMGEQQKED